MTYGELKYILDKYSISDDAHFLSNSGWECCETEMNGVYYNSNKNEIWFGQGEYLNEVEKEYKNEGFQILYPFYDKEDDVYKDFEGYTLFGRQYLYR